ncbi:hypothetical protein GCM10022251_58180 [Phytohabitans flavus]|uniref:Glycosyl hydrolase family 67 C-terminal domain-containing protein n=2 Tax=Phytohabitans flavus TaxID=1076124 RepID=A0A6F8XTC7_9ACTN|nr:hypothetical protein [Phytohabitans flavus]BCB77085.1 hypothetical protein Pflav_034950 [Phytohabitans flavus]
MSLGRGWAARPWIAGATAVVLLGIGAAIAWQVDKALGLSFTPANVPPEDLKPAPPRELEPAPALARVEAPADRRVGLAATAVAEAVAERGASRPQVATGSPAAAGGGPTLKVTLTEPEAAPGEGGLAGEAFRLRRAGADLVLEAATPAGASAGLYTVADRVRSGAPVLPPGDDGRIVAPRLGLRLVDSGAVGIDADEAGWAGSDDYSLNTDVVGPAVLSGPPYVDAGAVGEISAQFRQLVDHSLAQGYNGIVVQGFLEYVTFDGLGVYPDGDPHVARARAMVEHFGPVWRYAADMGMKVYFMTDMLALSPPLRTYLQGLPSGMNAEDARLWSVYQAGLREFFTSMPYAAGLMVRIGEGGDIYSFPGWDYTSEIAVKTPAAVRAMLRALLDVAGEGERDIIFRTWSIGVGAVGEMHIDAKSYDEVLGGIDDPHLIVSTKYCLGDYYSHLPFNHTLEMGTQRRIVEFQARREFEVFGSLPNDLGTLHGAALQQFLAANPHVEGVWTWTQGGGPLRAGPRTLYLREGFWQLYDLNVYSAARLAWDPDADPAQVTADWARQTFSADPATVAAIGEVMALSRQAVTKGLYIGPYANRTVKALGVHPPPMMWLFEWDIVTGDSAVLDSIYSVSRDRLDEAIGEGDEAVELAARMRQVVAGTDPATWRDPALRQRFVDTLDFQLNLFETLGAYRTMFLRYAQWLDTGDPEARAAWESARDRYAEARDVHLARYGDDVDLPAFRFPAADIGVSRAERDQAMAWLARALLALLVAAVLVGAFWRGRQRPGIAALRALWVGMTRPWRVGGLPPPPSTVDRVLVWALPAFALVLSRAAFSWFASPAHLTLTLGSWLLFALALRLLLGGADPYALWAALGGAATLRTLILLVGTASRGPGRYWFNFWTDPPLRGVYVTVAFAAFLWVFVAAYHALRAGYGLGGRRATGRVLVAGGAPVAVFGGVATGMGLERALSVWNDQMALLPWGLSRILGITVFLDIPPWLPKAATVAGVGLVAAGALLTLGRRTTRTLA